MPDTDHVGWGCGEGVGGVSGVKLDRGVLIRGALIGTIGCTCGGGWGGGGLIWCVSLNINGFSMDYLWISMETHG